MDYESAEEDDISWLTQSDAKNYMKSDIEDRECTSDIGNCISLEPVKSEVTGGASRTTVLYDNVVAEQISSDEELSQLDIERIISNSQATRTSDADLMKVPPIQGQKPRAVQPTGVNADEVLHSESKSSDGAKGNQPKSIRTFKQPVNEIEFVNVSKKRYAEESERKIKWALKMYSHWRFGRISNANCPPEIKHADLTYLYTFTQYDLSFALSRFVREIKKIDGSDYPPNTLREVIIMVQMYLHQNNIMWKLLDHPDFSTLRNVVDNTMRERTAMGLGVRKSSEIISLSHEDTLYNSSILGQDSPLQLLRTVVYSLGLHLALRGGVEHDRLRRPGFDSQISIEQDPMGIERLVYREDPLQKTHQGGLQSKGNIKTVYVYPSQNSERCPVTIYKKFIGLLPQSHSCKKLYLRPKPKPTPTCWYSDQPYGKNKVGTTVKDICKLAGIQGHFTNHSLRATSATRLYENKVDEQVIKEITGHKSDCVRTYKRTSDELYKEASEFISKPSKEPKKICTKVEDNVITTSSEKVVENVSVNPIIDQIVDDIVEKVVENHTVNAPLEKPKPTVEQFIEKVNKSKCKLADNL